MTVSLGKATGWRNREHVVHFKMGKNIWLLMVSRKNGDEGTSGPGVLYFFTQFLGEEGRFFMFCLLNPCNVVAQ